MTERRYVGIDQIYQLRYNATLSFWSQIKTFAVQLEVKPGPEPNKFE